MEHARAWTYGIEKNCQGTKVADLQLFGLPLGVCTEAQPRPPAEKLGMIQLAVMEVEVKRKLVSSNTSLRFRVLGLWLWAPAC